MSNYVLLQQRPSDYSDGEVLFVVYRFNVESDEEANAVFDVWLEKHSGYNKIQVGLYKMSGCLNSCSAALDIKSAKEITVEK